ncbi:MAG: twin-arginine translocase TatA/TatE family subunit [Opitutae bacterium]|nr:twin-arginine translocase TatA/TatE family subunit [Opitutae bacterium]
MSHVTPPLAGLFGLGAPELILVLVILLLLFGGAKLPALAKGLGQSIKEFKQAAKDDPAAEKKPEAKSETSGNDASKLRNN